MSDFSIDIEFTSPRLVGVELEYDAGTMEFQRPALPTGWRETTDGSLRNGYEYVLDPPVPISHYKLSAKKWADAWDEYKIGLASRGGFHVHVQAHDVDHPAAYRVVRLYTHFQPVINKLVGKSRQDNHFCPPYSLDISLESLIAMFNLNTSAIDRSSAKCARRYSVVNCAMLRCQSSFDRSLEFRQGSSSRRFSVVYGWPCFVTALTEVAIDEPGFHAAINEDATLDGLRRTMDIHQHSRGMSDWVAWRWDHLNAPITQDIIDKAKSGLTGTLGLNSVASRMDLSYPRAKELIQVLLQEGFAIRVGTRYSFVTSPDVDLNLLTTNA